MTGFPTDKVSTDYRKLLAMDVMGYVPVKIIPGVSGLLTIIVLTRSLTPDQYGVYAVVMATVLLLVQLAGTWLSNAVLFAYPDYFDSAGVEFKSLAVKLQIRAALPATLLAFLVVTTLYRQPFLGFLASGIVGFQLFHFLLMTFLQSERRVSGQALSVAIQGTLQILVLLFLVSFLDYGIWAGLTAVLSGFIGGLLVLAMVSGPIWRTAPGGGRPDEKEHSRALLSYGVPMCVWYFTWSFINVGDRILLKALGAPESLGQYAAFRDLFTGLAGFLTMPVLLASHPLIMMMWKREVERSEIEDLMTQNVDLLAFIFVPILVLFDLCGKELAGAVLGAGYALENGVMLAVIGSIFLGALAMYAQKGLEVTGQTARMTRIAVLIAAVSLGANMLVIPTFAVGGAASVVLVAQALYLLAVRWATRGILSPTISRSAVITLAVWVVGVEALVRSLAVFFGSGGIHGMSLSLRLGIVLGLSVFLFLRFNPPFLELYSAFSSVVFRTHDE